MGLAAELAKCRRLGVVHVVPHGLERLQVGKHSRQILIRHPAEDVPGHDLVELTRLHESDAHGFRKKRGVVYEIPEALGVIIPERGSKTHRAVAFQLSRTSKDAGQR